ncbi:uncharacterized protein LOC144103900 isoform X1 [Amblyomma americanum]
MTGMAKCTAQDGGPAFGAATVAEWLWHSAPGLKDAGSILAAVVEFRWRRNSRGHRTWVAISSMAQPGLRSDVTTPASSRHPYCCCKLGLRRCLAPPCLHQLTAAQLPSGRHVGCLPRCPHCPYLCLNCTSLPVLDGPPQTGELSSC